MTGTEYLRQVLKSQNLTDEEEKELTRCREDVEQCLKAKFGNRVSLRYAGSKAKGTVIRESYDLDVVCVFPEGETESLADLYKDTSECLAEKHMVQEKTSAIRVLSVGDNGKAPRDFHIDVVPVRLFDDKTDDAFIYLSSANQHRMKTNIPLHVNYVRDSGLQNVIRLAKLWKVRRGLSIRTFVLEVLAVQCLEKPSESLESDMIHFLSVCRDGLRSMRLLDPANTNNVISDLMSDADRSAIADCAAQNLEILNRNPDGDARVGAWATVLRESSHQIAESVTVPHEVITNPPSPWSTD
jgi:hypothetical protein